MTMRRQTDVRLCHGETGKRPWANNKQKTGQHDAIPIEKLSGCRLCVK